MTQPDRATARRLAQESLAKGDAIGWFDTLYVAAQDDPSLIPWADMRVNPNLASWLGTASSRRPRQASTGDRLRAGRRRRGTGRSAASRSRPSTFRPGRSSGAGEGFRDSGVDYCVADLLNPPVDWRRVVRSCAGDLHAAGAARRIAARGHVSHRRLCRARRHVARCRPRTRARRRPPGRCPGRW